MPSSGTTTRDPRTRERKSRERGGQGLRPRARLDLGDEQPLRRPDHSLVALSLLETRRQGRMLLALIFIEDGDERG